MARDEEGHRNPLYAIVATVNYLLLVDLSTKQITPIESHRPEYYGISWFPRGKELLLSHSRLDSAGLVDAASYIQSEIGVLSFGKEASEGFLSAPHQILCASDGRIVCANTGRNAVSVFDFKRPGFLQEARLSPSRWDRIDGNLVGDHINSVFEKDGRLYVLAHGHDKGSTLATFTYPDLELVTTKPVSGFTGLHNVWVDDDSRVMCCHSNAGALIDAENGKILWESGTPSYTRGLAVSSDFILVGDSEKAVRDQRRHSAGGLWMLDRRTLQVLDYFPLGPFGAVHEVRLLNGVDYAHHGHPFGGLDALLQRRLYRKLAKRKIEASRKASDLRDVWRGFENIFGVSTLSDRGARVTDHENLCLITQPASMGESEWDLKFGYSLATNSPGAHVSAVAYRGNGYDTDMCALLINAIDDRHAGLHLWHHVDGAWTILSTLDVGDLPLEGEARLHADLTGVELFIDKKSVAVVPIEQFPWQQAQFGIRWLGGMIFPPSTLDDNPSSNESPDC